MTAAQLYTLAPMIQGDWRDAYLMGLYARLRTKINSRAYMLRLAGLGDFNRSYPLED